MIETTGRPDATAALQKIPAPACSARDVAALLRARSTFVMVSHVKPDGDTLGACLALGHALRALGKRVHYLQQDPVPRNLRFMPGASDVTSELPAALPDDALWVFCDMSDISRAGDRIPPLQRENVLDIDHHLGNTNFGTLNYVLSGECSTGSCILKILDAMEAPITRDIATCLLTTIVTDTGGYVHANTTADVLRTSARLLDAGADQHTITQQIFANKRFVAVALLGEALATTRREFDGAFCWSVVDEEMLARHEADGEDTEEIVQHLASIEGVEVAVIFKAFEGEVRGSMRSTGRVNVQAAARRLGGGGHFRASGFSFDGPLEAAIVAVRAALVAEGL